MNTLINATVSIAIILLLIALAFFGISAYTEPFKDDDGSILQGSIASLEQITLGHMEQWILLRGIDTENPILLWLHGGPGAAQMPLAHALDQDLEKEFLVVHWDQRGAGKSNHTDFDTDTMTFEQFKSDAHELILHLLERFDQEKIYLLGHSWGTQLGLELVHSHPELFHAYIGVSHLIDNHEGLEIAYEWLRENLEEDEEERRLETLDKLGTPPYKHDEYREFANLVNAQGGNFDQGMFSLIYKAGRAKEYNFNDFLRWAGGSFRGGGPLHEEGEVMEHINFRDTIPAVDVPIFFIAGKNDYTTPLSLIEEYYELVRAPYKELIVLEESAHTPFLAETDTFMAEVLRAKEITYGQEFHVEPPETEEVDDEETIDPDTPTVEPQLPTEWYFNIYKEILP